MFALKHSGKSGNPGTGFKTAIDKLTMYNRDRDLVLDLAPQQEGLNHQIISEAEKDCSQSIN